MSGSSDAVSRIGQSNLPDAAQTPAPWYEPVQDAQALTRYKPSARALGMAP
jgi:hypothetical protein